MAILNYLYHAIAALALNTQAKYWSYQMRKGKAGSGNKLREIGGASNKHETERDNALREIKGWFE